MTADEKYWEKRREFEKELREQQEKEETKRWEERFPESTRRLREVLKKNGVSTAHLGPEPKND